MRSAARASCLVGTSSSSTNIRPVLGFNLSSSPTATSGPQGRRTRAGTAAVRRPSSSLPTARRGAAGRWCRGPRSAGAPETTRISGLCSQPVTARVVSASPRHCRTENGTGYERVRGSWLRGAGTAFSASDRASSRVPTQVLRHQVSFTTWREWHSSRMRSQCTLNGQSFTLHHLIKMIFHRTRRPHQHRRLARDDFPILVAIHRDAPKDPHGRRPAQSSPDVATAANAADAQKRLSAGGNAVHAVKIWRHAEKQSA